MKRIKNFKKLKVDSYYLVIRLRNAFDGDRSYYFEKCTGLYGNKLECITIKSYGILTIGAKGHFIFDDKIEVWELTPNEVKNPDDILMVMKI